MLEGNLDGDWSPEHQAILAELDRQIDDPDDFTDESAEMFRCLMKEILSMGFGDPPQSGRQSNRSQTSDVFLTTLPSIAGPHTSTATSAANSKVNQEPDWTCDDVTSGQVKLCVQVLAREEFMQLE